jgi:hypothetical protein
MNTISTNLHFMSKDIVDLLSDFILNHSSLESRNKYDDEIIVISPFGNYEYKALGDTGLKIQSLLIKKYNRFYAILSSLLKTQSKDTLSKITELNQIIVRTIEHQTTWCETNREALDNVLTALQKQMEIFNAIFEPSNGIPLYIPDTNALIYNPNIEVWSFDGVDKYNIFFMPTILSELDALKINHKNADVKNKAEMLIRKIKEYRRRGNIFNGVPLVKNKINVQFISLEPMIENKLSWLDLGNNDDRFLASVMDVMRETPQNPLTIVTRDINLQNKAEYASIPYVEPPII